MKSCTFTALTALVATFLILVSPLYATGVGDVEIRLNCGADAAFIGQTNRLEIWIANDAILDGMSLGFEFDIGRAYAFNASYGSHGYVNEEGDAVGVWNLGGLIVTPFIDNNPLDSILMGGAAIASGMPVHGTHSLCYTMEFTIPSGEQPLVDGFCVDNIYIAPSGPWLFQDGGGSYAPNYQGNPNSSSATPDAPQVCFDILNPCFADGDVDKDGIALTVTDYIKLLTYLQDCSYTPPVLYKCDISGDGVVGHGDIDKFDDYLALGMGAFTCGYPVMTHCDPCTYPTVVSTNPAKNAFGVLKTANVEVTHDFEIIPSSIENTTMFRVIGAQSGWKNSGTFNYDPAFHSETFDPTVDFAPGEMVIAYIAAGVQSICGVACPCYYQWEFTIKAKKGSGNFTTGTASYAGGNVSSTVAADFNNDGYLDLATVFENDGYMSCLLNDGTGELSLSRGVYPVGYNGASNSKPKGIVAADYDLDGDIDVVVVAGGDDVDASAFVLMENDGNGAFTSTGLQPLLVDGISHSTPTILTGDFNGDGYFDMLAAIHDYAVDSAAMLYFENDGEGVFGPITRGVYPVGYNGASNSKPAGLVAGDWDSDGRLDAGIVLGYYDIDTAATYTFGNTGGGEFYATGVYPVGFKGGASNKPAGLVSDFNGDGLTDIAMYLDNYDIDTAAVCMLINDGGGTFYATGVYPVGFKGGASNKPAGVVADVNADHSPDILTSDGSDDSLVVFVNAGDGTFTGHHISSGFADTVTTGYQSIVAGDFDGDEGIDIVVSLNFADTVMTLFGTEGYVCGDCDASGAVDIDDVVYLINYIFVGGPAPDPYEAGDANCSGTVDIDDVVYIIAYIFSGGPTPGDPDGDGNPDC